MYHASLHASLQDFLTTSWPHLTWTTDSEAPSFRSNRLYQCEWLRLFPEDCYGFPTIVFLVTSSRVMSFPDYHSSLSFLILPYQPVRQIIAITIDRIVFYMRYSINHRHLTPVNHVLFLYTRCRHVHQCKIISDSSLWFYFTITTGITGSHVILTIHTAASLCIPVKFYRWLRHLRINFGWSLDQYVQDVLYDRNSSFI